MIWPLSKNLGRQKGTFARSRLFLQNSHNNFGSTKNETIRLQNYLRLPKVELSLNKLMAILFADLSVETFFKTKEFLK